MSEAVNAVVETLVGFVCLGAGITVWRRPGLRFLALVLAFMSANTSGPRSVLESLPQQPAPVQPAPLPIQSSPTTPQQTTPTPTKRPN